LATTKAPQCEGRTDHARIDGGAAEVSARPARRPSAPACSPSGERLLTHAATRLLARAATPKLAICPTLPLLVLALTHFCLLVLRAHRVSLGVGRSAACKQRFAHMQTAPCAQLPSPLACITCCTMSWTCNRQGTRRQTHAAHASAKTQHGHAHARTQSSKAASMEANKEVHRDCPCGRPPTTRACRRRRLPRTEVAAPRAARPQRRSPSCPAQHPLVMPPCPSLQAPLHRGTRRDEAWTRERGACNTARV